MRVGPSPVPRSLSSEILAPAPAAPAITGIPAASPAEGPSAFAQILHGLGQRIDQGERTVRGALHAGQRDLGPAELLALQAGVYRYSEAVDLAAKLVDRGTSGVKTVLSGS